MENWEARKENVLPLKRGRNIKDLNENLEKVDTMKVSTLEKMQEGVFEASLNESNKTPLELLDAYSNYVKWTRDTFPTSSDKTLKILEVMIYFVAKTKIYEGEFLNLDFFRLVLVA